MHVHKHKPQRIDQKKERRKKVPAREKTRLKNNRKADIVPRSIDRVSTRTSQTPMMHDTTECQSISWFTPSCINQVPSQQKNRALAEKESAFCTSQIVALDNHTARRFSFVEREQRSPGGCLEYIVDTLARQRRTFKILAGSNRRCGIVTLFRRHELE